MSDFLLQLQAQCRLRATITLLLTARSARRSQGHVHVQTRLIGEELPTKGGELQSERIVRTSFLLSGPICHLRSFSGDEGMKTFVIILARVFFAR